MLDILYRMNGNYLDKLQEMIPDRKRNKKAHINICPEMHIFHSRWHWWTASFYHNNTQNVLICVAECVIGASSKHNGPLFLPGTSRECCVSWASSWCEDPWTACPCSLWRYSGTGWNIRTSEAIHVATCGRLHCIPWRPLWTSFITLWVLLW